MRVLPCGPDAVLLEFADGAAARAYAAGLAAEPLTNVVEVVPGARTVLLRADRPAAMRGVVAAARAVVPRTVESAGAREVVVRVTYDGADLPVVADLLAVSIEALVARHAALTWTVAFCGFAPGFAYLACPEAGWLVPRRESPRTRVPAGSVALAGEYCGCYPTVSPGGWQLIGRTDAALWDPDADPPALLTPGTRVRFVAAPRIAPTPDGSVARDRAAAQEGGAAPEGGAARAGGAAPERGAAREGGAAPERGAVPQGVPPPEGTS